MAHVDRNLISTTFDLAGYRIKDNMGLVRGIVVRSRSVIGNIGATFQILFGGNITLYTEMCERARMDAYRLMVDHAEKWERMRSLGFATTPMRSQPVLQKCCVTVLL